MQTVHHAPSISEPVDLVQVLAMSEGSPPNCGVCATKPVQKSALAVS